MNRRNWIKSSAVASAAITTPLILNKNVLGANDNLVMGIIGSGGRGCDVMRKMIRRDARFVAVCDVSEPKIATSDPATATPSDGRCASGNASGGVWVSAAVVCARD